MKAMSLRNHRENSVCYESIWEGEARGCFLKAEKPKEQLDSFYLSVIANIRNRV